MWAPALLLLLCARAAAAGSIEVRRISVPLGQTLAFDINITVEYILDFSPQGSEAGFPARLALWAGGGDVARPLLVTARQRAGAFTWQLPYAGAAGQPLHALQRTLCHDEGVVIADSSNCDAEGGGVSPARGAFSLHVSSACARAVPFTVRADAAADWRLAFNTPHDTVFDPTSPMTLLYEWEAGQESVRLVATSGGAECATVAVQNITCPIPETTEMLHSVGGNRRMTMTMQGAIHVTRSEFPRGFYVVGAVHESDEECTRELAGAAGAAGVWRAAAALPGARAKNITLRLVPALSRGQYLAATLATLALFLLVYAAALAAVAAQRLACWRPFVAPKAVLAADSAAVTDSGPAEELAAPARRRRDSTATFDSSDVSESDEDEEARPPPAPAAAAAALPTARAVQETSLNGTSSDGDVTGAAEPADGQTPPANGPATPAAAAPETPTATPFGLPARLNVAALARRRTRTLAARSDRYLHATYTVAVFYALPVLQFVTAFQIMLNYSGSLDLCYYNFLCAAPAGALSDFNHVYSNLGYLLLGLLFVLQVRRRRRRRRRKPRDEEYGIPAHHGLLEALGVGMMVVALLSATYHICPNGLNFQFDTAFMYVLAVLVMLKVYQARHPDVNARAHATFGVLAVLMALVVWGVLGGGAWFWGWATVLHVAAALLLSLRVYYVGQFRLRSAAAAAGRSLRALPQSPLAPRPLYAARLLLVLGANAVNWMFAIYGLVNESPDFATHLLQVLLCNALLYMLWYLAMKLVHGERLRWYAWLYLAGAAAAWAPSLYFFTSGSTNWAAAPAASRLLNHECKVLQFYDNHDLWHLLSAVALYLTFNALLTWDDGLSAVRRTDIAVF